MRMANWLIASVLIIIGIISTTTVSAAQDSSLVAVDSIQVQAFDFVVDPLRNVYAFTRRNTIVKYSPSGDSLFEYASVNYGMPRTMDVSNPLRPFLFFENYLVAVVLDRTLSELYEYQLTNFDMDVRLAAPASDNGIWMYNWASVLKRYDPNSQLFVESNQMQRQLIGFEPSQIFVTEGQILLHDERVGTLYQISRYGVILKQIETGFKGRVQLSGSWCTYFDEARQRLYYLNWQTEKAIQNNIPYIDLSHIGGVSSALLQGKFVYASTLGQILIFEYR